VLKRFFCLWSSLKNKWTYCPQAGLLPGIESTKTATESQGQKQENAEPRGQRFLG